MPLDGIGLFRIGIPLVLPSGFVKEDEKTLCAPAGEVSVFVEIVFHHHASPESEKILVWKVFLSWKSQP